MVWAYILFYKVVILSKDENFRLTKYKAETENCKQLLWFIRRKRVLITVLKN